MNYYFFIFEIGALLGFSAVLYRERRDRQALQLLALSFFYGMLLETLNIHMSQEIYSYSSAFALEIRGVPLSIGAGWAVIFYLARSAAERFRLAWWQSPFLMALYALSFDLAIDAVAIRLGFWHWKIPLDQEWFGVPYDNFFGWLAVVFTFALCLNLSSRDLLSRGYRHLLRYGAPFISALLLGAEIMLFINLSAVLSGQFSWSEAMAQYESQQYAYAYLPSVQAAKGHLLLGIILLLSALCLAWIRKRGEARERGDRFPLLVSAVIHLTFLLFLLASGIYRGQPVLLFISLAALALALALELPAHKQRALTR